MELDRQEVNMNLDESLKLTAVISPEDATIQRVTWSSSDTSVASVDKDGNVKGEGRGTAVITATTTDGTSLSASCTVTVSYYGGSKESMIINEIMAANIDMFVDPSWNYGGWLELYNPTDQSANIGLYWLSDDPNNLKKAMLPKKIGSIPAQGFFTLWFDHADTRKDIKENWLNTQVNMKLNPEGGTIYISDDQGNLIVSQDYPPAVKRASWARTADGGESWGWTASPSPSESNAGSLFAVQQLDMPQVDQPGQLFTNPIQVNVIIPSGSTLLYTTDGTTPTEQNGQTSKDGHFSVDATTTFRFRLFRDGYLPSDVVTRSYIYQDRNYYMPVVSIVTDPDNLYDDEIGVYVSGTNGKTANQDYTKRNFNMDWDRPVNFEYIVNGEEVVNQEVNYSISGGWSRKYIPKSFKLKANNVYGLKQLQYPFFSDKPYNRTKSVLLRNGGNDNYNKYRLKDVALQEIARLSGFKLNLQSVQPTHVFYNGEYIAMLNMRETSNKHYGYSNYGTDNDSIDSFEMSVDSGYVQKSGTREAFDHWYDLTVQLADDPQNPEIYQQICDIVDIDDYTNYFAFKFFLNDWDWPHNNCKAFRDNRDGKFHFIVFDLDNCVDRSGNNIFNDFAGKKTHTFYGRPEYDGTSITKEVELVTIFLNMIKNDGFRKKFIDTYCIVGGCVFRDDEENARIVNELAEERREALSWEGYDPVGNSKERSQGIISAISGNYKRNMMNVIRAYSPFGLTRTPLQAVKLGVNVSGAHISINGIEVPKSMFNGYLLAPDTLRAHPLTGYRFCGWQSGDVSTTVTSDIFPMGSSWKYYQNGSLDNTGWNTPSYSDTGWSESNSSFGFGNSGKPMSEATTPLERYDESNNSRSTYYFRKEFTLDAAPLSGETYSFNFEVDDGIIVYVNGTEIGTYHLPSGAVYADYVQTHYSDTYEGDDPYVGSFEISSSLLHKGKNVISVEVHNCNRTSSDLWFDGSLSVTRLSTQENQLEYVSTDETYILPSSGSHQLVACYAPLTEEQLIAGRITPIRINEISASNDIYVNEYFKKNDWVELYNTTDSDIDLSGMYISDNVKKPQKFQFAASDDFNTIIPAHGYKIVWCDKLEPLSQLHASFKLAAEGGDVLITSQDGSWADTLHYSAHNSQQTVGRYPDGTSDVYVLNTPTINYANILSSYDELYFKGSEIYSSVNYLLADNGQLSVSFAEGYVFIESSTANTAQLNLYTSVGQTIKSVHLNLVSGHASLFVGDMPAGVYVANIITDNRQTGSFKFIIK